MAADMRPARLAGVASRVDALSSRERAMAFLILLALAWAAWEHLLAGPLDTRRAALQARAEAITADIAMLDDHAATLAAHSRRDPDAEVRARLAELRREKSRLDAELRALSGRLLSPRHMAGVLERVLNRETALRLVRLEGLGAAALGAGAGPPTGAGARVTLGGGARAGARAGSAATPAGADDGATVAPRHAPTLYRHGLRIELEGGYLETLAYLRALESLGTGLLWQTLEFEVKGYPRSGVVITVHSLSLDDAWIGI